MEDRLYAILPLLGIAFAVGVVTALYYVLPLFGG